MGIRLDWEIESEHAGAHSATEDPNVVQARRRVRARFVITFLMALAVVLGIGAFIVWRLNEGEQRIEQFLRDTVSSEVAALRIGDWNAFSNIQRSADQTWTDVQQRQFFDDIQTAKTETDIQLTGTIRDVEIDGSRGRVLVEEIVGGVPYVRTWFYWRYEDGWRHVPPDYTFWGTAQQYNGASVTVRYNGLDEPFARELGVGVEGWVSSVCAAILQCGDFPHITIEIVPEEGIGAPQWRTDNPWVLRVASPYVSRARQDQPFSGEVKTGVASLIAERLVSESSSPSTPAAPPSDMSYLRQSVIDWLFGRFMGLNTEQHLVESLARNYGNTAVGELLRIHQENGSMAALAQVIDGGDLGTANLDWRDFLTWRLRLENMSLSESEFLSLYTPATEGIARERLLRVDPNAPEPTVVEVIPSLGDEGTPQLEAVVRYTGQDGIQNEGRVLFRLIDNVWRRAS
jgi:hypothetical protein